MTAEVQSLEKAFLHSNCGRISDFPTPNACIVDGCLFGMNELVVGYVEEALGENLGRMAVGIGVVGARWPPWRAVKLLGGVAYHGFVSSSQCTSVLVSIAGSPGWLTPKRLDILLGYPFRQLACDRVDAIIDEDNVRSIRLCEGLGFTRVGRFPRQYGERGGLIYCLLSEKFVHLNDFMKTSMRIKHG